MKLAHIMGIRSGFITGRKSPAVTQRAHELSVEFVYLGQETKMAAFEECVQKAGVREDEVADTVTICPIYQWLNVQGWQLPWAAAAELKAICHYITQARGGEGTARES